MLKKYLFDRGGSSLWLEGSSAFVAACGVQFPDQGLNLGPFPWEHRVSISPGSHFKGL